MNATDARTEQTATTAIGDSVPQARQLCRPTSDRMLGGVASGVASYLGIDTTIVRIAFAVLALVGGASVPIYLAGWLLIPDEATGQSVAADLLSSVQSRPR